MNDKEKINYQDFNELIDESKAELSSYIDKRLALTKLTIYEKLASASSYILYSLIIAVFLLILSFLILLGIGLFLGQWLHNYSAGFGILILIILSLVAIVFFCRKGLRRYFVNLTIRTIKKIEADEE